MSIQDSFRMGKAAVSPLEVIGQGKMNLAMIKYRELENRQKFADDMELRRMAIRGQLDVAKEYATRTEATMKAQGERHEATLKAQSDRHDAALLAQENRIAEKDRLTRNAQWTSLGVPRQTKEQSNEEYDAFGQKEYREIGARAIRGGHTRLAKLNSDLEALRSGAEAEVVRRMDSAASKKAMGELTPDEQKWYAEAIASPTVRSAKNIGALASFKQMYSEALSDPLLNKQARADVESGLKSRQSLIEAQARQIIEDIGNLGRQFPDTAFSMAIGDPDESSGWGTSQPNTGVAQQLGAGKFWKNVSSAPGAAPKPGGVQDLPDKPPAAAVGPRTTSRQDRAAAYNLEVSERYKYHPLDSPKPEPDPSVLDMTQAERVKKMEQLRAIAGESWAPRIEREIDWLTTPVAPGGLSDIVGDRAAGWMNLASAYLPVALPGTPRLNHLDQNLKNSSPLSLGLDALSLAPAVRPALLPAQLGRLTSADISAVSRARAIQDIVGFGGGAATEANAAYGVARNVASSPGAFGSAGAGTTTVVPAVMPVPRVVPVPPRIPRPAATPAPTPAATVVTPTPAGLAQLQIGPGLGARLQIGPGLGARRMPEVQLGSWQTPQLQLGPGARLMPEVQIGGGPAQLQLGPGLGARPMPEVPFGGSPASPLQLGTGARAMPEVPFGGSGAPQPQLGTGARLMPDAYNYKVIDLGPIGQTRLIGPGARQMPQIQMGGGPAYPPQLGWKGPAQLGGVAYLLHLSGQGAWPANAAVPNITQEDLDTFQAIQATNWDAIGMGRPILPPPPAPSNPDGSPNTNFNDAMRAYEQIGFP